MLKLSKISYSISGKPLFEDASATLPSGHKIGLVGRNGAGKTTLFRLLRAELALEGGHIELPKNARIGGVAQEVPSSEITLLDSVLSQDTERSDLLKEAETAKDAERIADIHARLADIEAWSAEARAASILNGLGFSQAQIAMPCSAFSGGWRMRVALAGVLFAAPDLLLLDEPTNYLDLEGALWLESYLMRYPHTVLVISHDRGLLNRSVTSILHLEDRKLTLYNTPYDGFAKTRAARIAAAQAVAKKQEARRAHLQSYVDRFRYKADKAKQAQSRLKAISKLEPISLPQEAALKRFTFPEPEELSPPILRIENGEAGYNGTPVLKKLDLRIDQDDRIALLGQNGQGKSTLAKLIADRLTPMAGRVVRSSKLRIGFFAQHQLDELRREETPFEHIKRLRPVKTPAQIRAILGGFGIGSEQADTTVQGLSGGQKARLSLLIATLDAPHLLILDEPTNHLDIESREALLEALSAYSGAVILVSHDMHLLSLVADRLWLVKDGRVAPYPEDLEHYRNALLGKSESKEKSKSGKSKPKPAAHFSLAQLKKEVTKCEERLEKLNVMQEKLAQKLADPVLYEAENAQDLEIWNKKYAEVMEALERAEQLWMEASERLESAQNVS